jgi:hypothetical protein
VDLSLDKLAMTGRKCLSRVVLFKLPNVAGNLLMDVNKPGELADGFVWA